MSISLDGNDCVSTTIAPVANYGASGLTLVVWGKRATNALSYLVHLGQNDSTNLNSAVLRTTSGGAAQATQFDATSNSNATTTAEAIDTAWHHYAAVFATASSRIAYLDGTASTTGTGARTLTADFDIVRIGASCAAASFWTGELAHVAIWDTALSGAQISSLSAGANPLTIESANLVAYWPFTTSGSSFLVDTVAGLTLIETSNPEYDASNPTVDAPPGGTVAALSSYYRMLRTA